mmetsp:Transcript_245/g.435  ORF Transcript_245/g.435 Transcript_245/m.435 type:complete len:278 (-) Transcript_245:267-1100(-)
MCFHSDVLPPDDLAVAVAAIREDRALREALRPRYDDVTKRIEDQLRTESRSIGDLMGEKAEAQLLTALEDVAGDADATRSFLRTPAVENVIGNVLYEGIYEFIQTVDLLGNIINKLPLIGPMRQQVMASFKKEIDRTLGKQVKSFLVSYSRLATEQMASMVLSEENAKGFASARRKLGEELLQRPLSSLVPSARACQEARDGAWAIAESPLPLSDEEIIDRIYAQVGDTTIDELGFSPTPKLQELAQAVLERFLESEEGKGFLGVEVAGAPEAERGK